MRKLYIFAIHLITLVSKYIKKKPYFELLLKMYLQIDTSVQVILANRSFMKPKNSHFMNIYSLCFIPIHEHL